MVKEKNLERLLVPILGLSSVRRIPGRPGCSPRPLGAAGTLSRRRGSAPPSEGGWGLPAVSAEPRGWGCLRSFRPRALVSRRLRLLKPGRSLPWSEVTAASGSESTDGISSRPRVKGPRPGGPGGGPGARRTLGCLDGMRQRGVLNFGLSAYPEAGNAAGSFWVPRGRGSSLVLDSLDSLEKVGGNLSPPHPLPPYPTGSESQPWRGRSLPRRWAAGGVSCQVEHGVHRPWSLMRGHPGSGECRFWLLFRSQALL